VYSVKLVNNLELFCSEEHVKFLNDLLDKPENKEVASNFRSVLETDSNGLISMFRPSLVMTMDLLWFLQSLMLSQRCYLIDQFLKKEGVLL